MLNGNQLERYGAVAKAMGVTNMIAPNAKVFFIGATTLPSYQDFVDDFPIDKNGGNRIFPTVAAAVADGNVVASRGDICFMLPGHTETISSSTALTLSKAGIIFIGLGTGSLRPTITLDTATTATINVTAANLTFRNTIFVANFAAVAACFTLTTAAEFQLIDCEFRDTDSSHNFIAIVVTDTTSNHADGLVIKDCKLMLLATSGAVKIASALGTNDRWFITGNYYKTPTTNAGAVLPIATGKIITNLLFDDNKLILVNASGTATGVIITTNGSTNTGYLSNNKIQVATTTPLLITASSGFVQTNNLLTHTADKSGYVMPVIDASS